MVLAAILGVLKKMHLQSTATYTYCIRIYVVIIYELYI